MRRILCFLGGHRWKYLHTRRYIDDSWGYRLPSLEFIKKCTCCGKVKDGHFYGCDYISAENLNKQ